MVGVWHIFEDTVDSTKREMYGTIWEMLHKELEVPIEFTYILYDSKKNKFYPINRYTFIDPKKITLITANTLPIDHPDFDFTYKFQNPQLLKNLKTRQLRDLIINYIEKA